MTSPTLGYIGNRPADDPVVVAGADFSKVVMISTSADADPAVFPLNIPVRFASTDATYLAKLGTGYLYDAVLLLNAQLKGMAADLMVIRVAESTSSTPATKLSETLANVVGDPAQKTGIYAALTCAQVCKAIPGLFLVPGYDAPQPGGPTVANPVLAALPAVLDALQAFAPVNVSPASLAAAVAARGTLSSMRMMPVGIAVRAFKQVGGVSVLTTMPASPIVAGLFVRKDNALGGRPFDTICGEPVYGISDISRPIAFSMTDGATEGQQMLAADVSIIVRGESADRNAIAEGGFIFLGWETCDISGDWTQAHQVRGQDYIDAEEQAITRKHVGKRITPRLVESWLGSLDNAMLDHTRNDPPDILGYKIVFAKPLNSANSVEAGMLRIQSYIQQAPIFLVAQNDVRKFRPALEALVAAVSANTGPMTATV